MVQLRDLEALVHLQCVVHVDEFLQQLCLIALSQAVLLFPACGEFLVQSIHFVFMFRYQVVYLNFNAMSSVRKVIFPLTFRQLFDLLADTINLWIAARQNVEDFRIANEQV